MNTIPELDKKGLREFAIVTGGVLAGIFGLFLPWIFERGYPYWPWIVWAVLGGWGLIAPISLRPVYTIWMKFALLLGKVTTPLILGIVFYLVFFPVAMIFRILRKDPMKRRLDENSPTYRVASDEISRDSLEKPF